MQNTTQNHRTSECASPLPERLGSIRPATEADLPEVLRMGRAFLACTTFAHLSFDDATAEKLVRGLIEGAGVLFVAPSHNGLAGMIAMIAFPHYFNARMKAAQEFFYWVEPQARGSGIAIRLIDAAEKWAKTQGCSTVHMLALDALNGEEVAKLYTRRGYVPLERTYVRSIL